MDFIKLFIFLALAAVGAMTQDITKLDFTLDGKKYSGTVADGEDYKVVIVPKQGLADHTMIMHDFKLRITVFKDLTTGRCIAIPMNSMLTRSRGLIFKDRMSSKESVPSNRNVMLVVSQEEMGDVEMETGQKIGELCQGLPTYWARISREESTLKMSARRFRRAYSWSRSVSTDGNNTSISEREIYGSKSASSQASSNGSSTSASANSTDFWWHGLW